MAPWVSFKTLSIPRSPMLSQRFLSCQLCQPVFFSYLPQSYRQLPSLRPRLHTATLVLTKAYNTLPASPFRSPYHSGDLRIVLCHTQKQAHPPYTLLSHCTWTLTAALNWCHCFLYLCTCDVLYLQFFVLYYPIGNINRSISSLHVLSPIVLNRFLFTGLQIL